MRAKLITFLTLLSLILACVIAIHQYKKKENNPNDATTAVDTNIFANVDGPSSKKPLVYNTTKFVHMIPHSHTDLGWLGTVEEYFEGSKNLFYMGSIYSMFTTVV